MYIGVTNLMNTTYSPYIITVRWDAANSLYSGGVLYYTVMISSDEHCTIPNDIINLTGLNTTFSNLRSDTNYNITVTAVNEAGAGMTSELISVRTSSSTPPQSNASVYICSKFYIYIYICIYICQWN